MALALVCQEIRDACQESLGSPCSLCSQCLEDSLAEEWEGQEMQEWTGDCLSSPLSQYAKALLSLWKGCDSKSKVRELEGRRSVSLCVLVYRSEGRKEGCVPPFESETAAVGMRGFSLFRLCAVIFSSHGRSSTGNALLSARSHDACVSKPRKTELDTFFGSF